MSRLTSSWHSRKEKATREGGSNVVACRSRSVLSLSPSVADQADGSHAEQDESGRLGQQPTPSVAKFCWKSHRTLRRLAGGHLGGFLGLPVGGLHEPVRACFVVVFDVLGIVDALVEHILEIAAVCLVPCREHVIDEILE